MKKPTNTKIWGIGFPNSLVDFNPVKTFNDLKECGTDEFIVCTCIYNGYRMVMPRNKTRYIYSLEEGKIYFKPDMSFYKDCNLKPILSDDFKNSDVLEISTSEGKKAGINTSAWFCYFANGLIAKTHPEYAVENVCGSKDRLFLCWNNPEVRKHAFAITEDIVTRYNISSIMADKIPQTVFELNTFSGRIDPIVRTLASFCFCEHCIKAASKAGIDLNEAKKRALEIADQSKEIPPHIVNELSDELKGDHEIPLFLLDEPIFFKILKWRIDSVIDFLGELKSRIRKIKKDVKLGVCYVPPVKIGHDATSPRSWLAAQSYKAASEIVDTIHAVIHWEDAAVRYDTMRAASSIGENCELSVHLKAYGSTKPQSIASLATSALECGADSMAFFCYDLMSDPMLKQIKHWANE